MSEGKVAAQVSHAVLGLKEIFPESVSCDDTIVVLKVSDSKFNEILTSNTCYVHEDLGYTEVDEGTVTAAAYLID